MTALPAGWLPLVLLTIVAVSPLLAGWSAALASGVTSTWWQPRRISVTRWAIVAAVVTTLTAAGAAAHAVVPWPGWVLFAAGETAVLTITAIVDGDGSRLLRAACAAAVVGGVWLGVVFLAPAAMGLGDVRLLAVTAGLLGWISWPAVLAGQLLTFVLASVTAAGLAARRSSSFRRLQVPMGPAIVGAAVITCWL